MRHSTHCQLGPEELGPYLLGGLAPQESAKVGRAVDACPACSAEVTRLRPVVVALEGARPEELGESLSTMPGGDLALESVLTGVAGHRRAARRQRVLLAVAAAAAACIAVAAVVTGLALRSDPDGTRVVIAYEGITGEATLANADGGTRIDLSIAGLTPGAAYGVWLEDSTGQRVPAGSFRPDKSGSRRLELHAALPLDDSEAVGMTRLGAQDTWREPLPEG